MRYDISQASFIHLVDFYFNRPPMNYGKSDQWYLESDLEIEYDAARNAQFFIDLFKEPAFLLEKFERGQLDQGFWAMMSYGFDGNVADIIFEHRNLPLQLRQECIRAMYDLHAKLFSVDTMGQSTAFWWGHFAGYYHGIIHNDPEKRALIETLFETLLRIIRLESDYCQSCALDGLAKLRHMETAPSLRAFLAEKRKWSATIRRQAMAVIEDNPSWDL